MSETDSDTEEAKYDIANENRRNDDETGQRYLAIFNGIDRVASNNHVLAGDLRRAVYAVGRAFPHGEILREARGEYGGSQYHPAEESIRYECDQYAVDASEHYFNAFQDVLKHEFCDDEGAARADAKAYGENLEDLDAGVEEAAEHYRDRLRLALFELMKQADGSDSGYPASYPLVVLKTGDRA